ncbi:MAG: hypothetical protein ACPH8C_07430, partial [Candidatus Puniceispirillaceae bacterium]
QVAAFFDHLGAGDFPMGTGPVEFIGLQLAHDVDTALAQLRGAPTQVEVVIVGRDGAMLGRAGALASRDSG